MAGRSPDSSQMRRCKVSPLSRDAHFFLLGRKHDIRWQEQPPPPPPKAEQNQSRVKMISLLLFGSPTGCPPLAFSFFNLPSSTLTQWVDNQPNCPRVDDFLPKRRTCRCTRKYQPAYAFSLDGASPWLVHGPPPPPCPLVPPLCHYNEGLQLLCYSVSGVRSFSKY